MPQSRERRFDQCPSLIFWGHAHALSLYQLYATLSTDPVTSPHFSTVKLIKSEDRVHPGEVFCILPYASGAISAHNTRSDHIARPVPPLYTVLIPITPMNTRRRPPRLTGTTGNLQRRLASMPASVCSLGIIPLSHTHIFPWASRAHLTQP